MNVLSLFDGISCGQLALERANIKVDSYYASEIDQNCIQLTQRHFPNTIQLGDVCKIDDNVLKTLPKIDLLIGGSPCFTEETLVLTKEGYKELKNIKIGDKVLNHMNTYSEVSDFMNQGEKTIWKLKGMCFDEINTTENHLFFIRTKYYKYNSQIRKNERKFTQPQWKRCDELTKNDYVGVAINQESKLPVWNGVMYNGEKSKYLKNTLNNYFENESFWYLCGRYVGDGWCRKRKERGNNLSGIIICCGKHKIENFENKINDLFHYSKIEDRTTFKYQFSNRELAEFMSNFGMGAMKKRIPGFVFDLPINLLKSFLDGYTDSDGSIRDNKFSVTSVSKELVYGLGQCVAKVYKKPFSIYKVNRPKKHIIEGRTVNQNDTYIIRFKFDEKKQDKAFYDNGYIWCPLKSINNTNEKKNVYDITVNDSHSFTANSCIVHNCQNLSRAGNGMGLKGDESKLFYEYVRVLKWIKENNNPNIKFLLENVEMKNSNKEIISNELKTQPILINSKLVSAQNRPRLYWCNFNVDLPNDKNIKLKDILIDEDIDLVEKNGLKFDIRLSEKSMNLVFIHNNQIAVKQATKQGFIYALDGDGINLQFPTSKTRRGRVIKQKSSTLDRQCDCCVLINDTIRKLNINELEKLQTLPVDYTIGFSENERKSMIGNGWTVDVIAHIFKNLN